MPSAGLRLAAAIPEQTRHNWCWAACATGVAHFYDSATRWTQCLVAGAALDRSDCCEERMCDEPWCVWIALDATGNLAGKKLGSVSWRTLKRELKRGHPVVVRVQFPVLGHFVVVDGYRRWRVVVVKDPDGARETEMSYWRLLYGYDHSGSWSHSYLTRP